MSVPLPKTPPWPGFFGQVVEYDTSLYTVADLDEDAFSGVPAAKVTAAGALTLRMIKAYGVGLPGNRIGGGGGRG